MAILNLMTLAFLDLRHHNWIVVKSPTIEFGNPVFNNSPGSTPKKIKITIMELFNFCMTIRFINFFFQGTFSKQQLA
jgi:hypothetical protein